MIEPDPFYPLSGLPLETHASPALHAARHTALGSSFYRRRASRVVNIGGVPLGGHYPIRVQSMTTVDTMDTRGSVEQAIRMIERGCEYVRITAPGLNEARNLESIKKELRFRGYRTPLVADIHFTPNAAELAARIVEKVRINPGNYADRKRFEQLEYSPAEYQRELERIRARFLPLIQICKSYGTAMRIGANHGSLSDRIMSHYGDTPLGMVESALEFVRICAEENYHEIVLSMKASNPQVTVQAYRLLDQKLEEEKLPPYPFHLGVTEAGDGHEGRVKSAIGIGVLLEDGLGDTIRVSLTEEPEDEMPPAKILANRRLINKTESNHCGENELALYWPTAYRRRIARSTVNLGGGHTPVVVADLSALREEAGASLDSSCLASAGYRYRRDTDAWSAGEVACDYIYMGSLRIDFAVPESLGVIYDFALWRQLSEDHRTAYPLFEPEAYLQRDCASRTLNFIRLSAAELSQEWAYRISYDPTAVIWLTDDLSCSMPAQRHVLLRLSEWACTAPLVFHRRYPALSWSEIELYASTDLGGLYIDGLGDGICISSSSPQERQACNETAFRILQAARMRISKAEYISCPSCGRTLFPLQETTARIKARTDHLKGVKIAIMGCIVNGPGEMADADYGYVGSGPQRITLYRGREVVKRNVPSDRAVEELIELIRQDGCWVDPIPNQNVSA